MRLDGRESAHVYIRAFGCISTQYCLSGRLGHIADTASYRTDPSYYTACDSSNTARHHS